MIKSKIAMSVFPMTWFTEFSKKSNGHYAKNETIIIRFMAKYVRPTTQNNGATLPMPMLV